MLDRRNRRLERSVILLIIIVLVIAATAVYAFLQLRVDQISSLLKNKLPINVLFIVSEGGKPLFFEVFLYNPETRKGAVFHVPTNLGGVIESLKRVDGIDALYKRGNPEPVVKRIEGLLGIGIQCVIDISRGDVCRIADLIGGLVLFIPNPVDQIWEGRRILLPSGSVALDGDKIVDFISYEDPLEQETDTSGRKQKFIQSLLKGFGENNQYLQGRATFRLLRSFMRTTLAPRALGSFITEMGKFDPERMVLQRVLGNSRMVDGRELLFPHQDGDLLKEAVKQTLEANASSEYVPAEDLTVTVEVLNGTKTPGLASRARELYRSFDMDVLSIGNADNDAYEATVVLDRKGRLEDAKKVADIIKCTQVFSRPDALMDQAVEVTVILGKDFDGRYCKQ
jgi:anionic cell wall polymer biosynthesis LytR-Cps2A-Psr (LCP) family protein